MTVTPEPQLTKLTVNLTPKSTAAMGMAAMLTGDSQTEVVNRALQVYGRLADLSQHEGVYRLDLDVGGAPMYVLASRTAPRGRRWLSWLR